ncbi:MAG: cadherin-like domain-containing protein, partial [Halioglobus sp.]|nr:cadherin-like domain-containing protein [Halioglobus sp.]
MSKNGANDRDASTEQLFSLRDRKEQRLNDEDERLAQSAPGNEELSLQNVFIDKEAPDAEHGGTPAAVTGEGGAHGADMVGEPGLRGPAEAWERNDAPALFEDIPDEFSFGDTTDETAPVLITSMDLLEGLGERFAHISNVRIDEALGNILDNGDNTWTLRPAPDFSGGDLPVRFDLTSDGKQTEIENRIELGLS